MRRKGKFESGCFYIILAAAIAIELLGVVALVLLFITDR